MLAGCFTRGTMVMQHDLPLTHLQCASVTQDAKQGVRNLLSRHSLLAELQAKGVLNIIPQVPARFQCSQAPFACFLTFGVAIHECIVTRDQLERSRLPAR